VSSSRAEVVPRRASLLSRLRVVQHGRSVSAVFAGKLLADFGAIVHYTVVKSEPAGPWDPESSSEAAEAYERYFNERKQPLSEGELLDAVVSADIVLLDRESLDDERLSPSRLLAQRPSLIVTAISPYGLTGPKSSWRATDFTLQARGGLSYGVGEAEGPPLPLPGRQAEMQGGMSGAIGSLLAVFARDASGRSQLVDISIDDVISTFFTGYYLPRYIYGGGVPGRRSGRMGSNSAYPNTVMRCADGLVAMIAPQLDQWIRFVKLMGEPDWTKDPRYRNRRAMQWEYKAEVDRLVEPWFSNRTKAALIEDFIANRVPFAPVLDGQDLLRNEHLSVRSAIRRVRLQNGPDARVPEPPYLIAEGQPGLVPFPTGSSDSGETCAGRAKPILQADEAGALRGIRVLDLGTAWAGGMAGRILADFGAEVIKVESSRHLDGSRRGRPIGVEDVDGGDEGRWPEMQPGFHVISRNKFSLGIDLQTAGAAQLLADLAGSCDVVIHNFSTGVMDRLGLSEDRLRSRNAGLVIVGQSVAGYTGPMAGYVGYNSTVGGLSGFFHEIGYEGEEPIGTAEGLFSDIVSALTTVYGVLSALLGARGSTVEISQWEATLALIPEVLIAASTGAELSPCGRRIWGVAPHGMYPCQGDDQWIAVSISDGETWAAFCSLIGRTDLVDDKELATVGGRRQRGAEVDEIVRAWSLQHDAVRAAELAQQVGIAADVANHIGDLFADEHLRSREGWIDTEHPLVGFEPLPGVGLSLSATPGTVVRTAPFLGQHTDLILERLLGYSPAKIKELIDQGIVERSTFGTVR
jgi:crotonobetainyl-CoA:carnitine CoA-transferase CaiB-like acyl-CoA transferase